MVLEVAHTLEGWGEFYVVVGAAAAALTGLMFVVIALRAEGQAGRSVETFETYGTPTVVQLASVLLISAIATVPDHTTASLAACLSATGLSGLAYTLYNTRQVRQLQSYVEVFSDWMWRHVGPGLVFVALPLAGIVLWIDTAAALYVVGAAAVAMLFIGIHNAWDSAVWIAADHSEDESG